MACVGPAGWNKEKNRGHMGQTPTYTVLFYYNNYPVVKKWVELPFWKEFQVCPEHRTHSHSTQLSCFLFTSGNTLRLRSKSFLGFLPPARFLEGVEVSAMAHANLLCSTQKPLTVSPLVSSPLSEARPSTRNTVLTYSVKSVTKVMSQESLNQALHLGPTESLSGWTYLGAGEGFRGSRWWEAAIAVTIFRLALY